MLKILFILYFLQTKFLQGICPSFFMTVVLKFALKRYFKIYLLRLTLFQSGLFTYQFKLLNIHMMFRKLTVFIEYLVL